MEKNNEMKKGSIKNRTVVISMTIKIEDFDFDNILQDEKLYENIFFYKIFI